MLEKKHAQSVVNLTINVVDIVTARIVLRNAVN